MVLVVMVMFMVPMLMAVMPVPMFMMMPFLLPMNHHPHMGPGNALPPDAFRLQRHTGKKPIHIPQKLFLLRAQLVQRTHKHITRRAHSAFKI